MRWRSSRRALVKECEKRLADLPVPVPFSVEALVRNMETVRGRHIYLLPLDEHEVDLRTACGLRATTEDVTLVLYRRRPTRQQTEHTILHELAHEWFDHGTTLTAEEVEQYIPVHIRQGLIDRLGPRAVIQARARYDTPEEQQAELSASLVKRMASRQLDPGDDVVSRLESSLSHPVAPPRRRWTQ